MQSTQVELAQDADGAADHSSIIEAGFTAILGRSADEPSLRVFQERLAQDMSVEHFLLTLARSSESMIAPFSAEALDALAGRLAGAGAAGGSDQDRKLRALMREIVQLKALLHFEDTVAIAAGEWTYEAQIGLARAQGEVLCFLSVIGAQPRAEAPAAIEAGQIGQELPGALSPERFVLQWRVTDLDATLPSVFGLTVDAFLAQRKTVGRDDFANLCLLDAIARLDADGLFTTTMEGVRNPDLLTARGTRINGSNAAFQDFCLRARGKFWSEDADAPHDYALLRDYFTTAGDPNAREKPPLPPFLIDIVRQPVMRPFRERQPASYALLFDVGHDPTRLETILKGPEAVRSVSVDALYARDAFSNAQLYEMYLPLVRDVVEAEAEDPSTGLTLTAHQRRAFGEAERVAADGVGFDFSRAVGILFDFLRRVIERRGSILYAPSFAARALAREGGGGVLLRYFHRMEREQRLAGAQGAALLQALIRAQSDSDIDKLPKWFRVQERAATEIARGAGDDRIHLVYFENSSGLGANGRMFRAALERSGAPLALSGLDTEKDRFLFSTVTPDGGVRMKKAVNLFCVNANDLVRLFVSTPRARLADLNIGFLLWETSQPPRKHLPGASILDQVWTPTEYLRRIYADLLPEDGRVRCVGKHIEWGAPGAFDARARLGLDPSAKLFLTIADFNSGLTRKNPLAAAEAFERAEIDPQAATLVIKMRRADLDHWSNIDGYWERLQDVVRRNPNMTLLSGDLSVPEYWGLLHDIDAFLSLHKSEGFGYGAAHAMGLGKPVIVSDYSGTQDFCTPETAELVPVEETPVDPREMNETEFIGYWARPDLDAAAAAIRSVAMNYDVASEKAARAADAVRAQYSFDAFQSRVVAALRDLEAIE